MNKMRNFLAIEVFFHFAKIQVAIQSSLALNKKEVSHI